MYGKMKKQDKMYRPVGGGKRIESAAQRLPAGNVASKMDQLKREPARLAAIQQIRNRRKAV